MQPEYLATPQTLPDGGSQNLMLDAIGNLKVTLAGNGLNITTATTTLVKTGAGSLHSVTINATAAGTISIYDGINAGGTLLATLPSSATVGTYTFDVNFAVGLCIVTAAASNLTVSYR